MKEYKRLRVTLTEDYYIEMIDDERTYINGWNIKKVIKNWFKDGLIYHATRDGHKICGSQKYISFKIVDVKTEKKGNVNK